jgi:hypothetical protein
MSQKGEYVLVGKFDNDPIIKGLDEVQRAYKHSTFENAETEKKARKLIDGNYKQSVRGQKKANKELTRIIKGEFKEQEKAGFKTMKHRQDAHQKMLQRLEAAEKSHTQRMGALGKRVRGRDGGGISLGGMKAGAMAGVAAVTGIAVAFGKAAQAAKDFEDKAIRIQTLLSDAQAERLPQALAMLRTTAKETGAPLGELETSLYNVISAVPELANNLQAAAGISEKAAKASVALGGSTDEMTLAATNLGNAMGLNLAEAENQNKVFDILANTMKQGVIPSASTLASNIAKAAPAMKALSDSATDGVNTLGAMNAILTASGVSVEETQTQIKALTTELFDQAKVQKLVNAGVKGFDPDTGKIKDWSTFMQSAAAQGQDVLNTFTSVEAKNAFRILADNGAQAFADMNKSMATSGGTAEQMFRTMEDSSAVAGAKLEASWNDAMISVGQGVNSMMTEGKKLLAGAINWVADFFKSSEDAYQEQLAQFQQTASAAEALGQAMPNIAEMLGAGETAAAAEALRGTLANVATISQEGATYIDRLLNSPLGETAEGLAQIADEVGRITQMGEMKAALEGVEAQKDMFSALRDEIEESVKTADLFSYEENVAELAELNAMQTRTTEQEQRRFELENETTKQRLASNSIQAAITAKATEYLQIEKDIAKANGETLTQRDLEEKKLKLIADMRAEMGERDIGFWDGARSSAADLYRTTLAGQLNFNKLVGDGVDGIMKPEQAAAKAQLAQAASLQTEIARLGVIAKTTGLSEDQRKQMAELTDEYGAIIVLADEALGKEEAGKILADERLAIEEQLTSEAESQIASTENLDSIMKAQFETAKALGVEMQVQSADKLAQFDVEIDNSQLITKELEGQIAAIDLQIATKSSLLDLNAAIADSEKRIADAQAGKEVGAAPTLELDTGAVEQKRAALTEALDAQKKWTEGLIEARAKFEDESNKKREDSAKKVAKIQEGADKKSGKASQRGAQDVEGVHARGQRSRQSQERQGAAQIEGMRDKGAENRNEEQKKAQIALTEQMRVAANNLMVERFRAMDAQSRKDRDDRKRDLQDWEHQVAATTRSLTGMAGTTIQGAISGGAAADPRLAKELEAFRDEWARMMTDIISSSGSVAGEMESALINTVKELDAVGDKLMVIGELDTPLTDPTVAPKLFMGVDATVESISQHIKDTFATLTDIDSTEGERYRASQDLLEITTAMQYTQERRNELLEKSNESQAKQNELFFKAEQNELARLEHRRAMGEFDDKEQTYLFLKLGIQDRINEKAADAYKNGLIGELDLWQIEEDRHATVKAINAEYETLANTLSQIQSIPERARVAQAGKEERAKVIKAQGLDPEEEEAQLKKSAKMYRQEMTDLSNEVVDLVQGTFDTLTGLFDQATQLLDTFAEGTSRAKVEAIGDIAQATGEALLQAPYPLNVVGAMMVGGAKIAQFIGKIADLVSEKKLDDDENYQRMLSETALMEDRLALHKQQLAQIQIELEMQQRINDLYEARNDQAVEQMEIDTERMGKLQRGMMRLWESLDERAQQDIGILTFDDPENLAKQIAKMQSMIQDAESEIAKHKDRLQDRLNKGDEKKHKAAIKHLQAEIEMFGGMIENAEDYLGVLDQQHVLQQQMISEQMDLLDLLHDIGVEGSELLNLYTAIIDAQTPEEVVALLRESGALLDQEAETRKALASLSEDDRAYWETKLGLATQAYEQALEDHALGLITQDELLARLKDKMDIESDILGLKEDQNEEDDEALQKLKESLRLLHQERQALILKAREGELTEEEKARVAAIERSIIEKMIEQGASPEAIAAAKEGFASASYATGVSSVPRDDLYFLHKGEGVTPADTNEALRQYLAHDPYERIRPILDTWAAIMGEMRMAGGGTGGQNIEIHQYIEGVSEPERAAEISRDYIEEVLRDYSQRMGTSNGR